ncbi:fumarylacetoacetate hydrolase family protein [Nocardia cyriacigeorgica]|uniref:fumarylacetoacetate hydrolase family protein n=1 Tax=Nocardia cyriacigeorgica TaxID=135487 RepID=UPI00273E3E99|nr:fumarylacetoacetate hydrolase family protein [Nocardia cyriacigeorgica]
MVRATHSPTPRTRSIPPPKRPTRKWCSTQTTTTAPWATLSGVPISARPYTNALDFELELGVVLGAPLKNATVEEAAAAIAAVVVVNDFCARDVQLAEMRSGSGRNGPNTSSARCRRPLCRARRSSTSSPLGSCRPRAAARWVRDGAGALAGTRGRAAPGNRLYRRHRTPNPAVGEQR